MAIMARTVATGTRPPLAAAAPLRRCTYRKITTISRRREVPLYEAACTFPDRRAPATLGDLESARSICAACTFNGIFRADSD
jgi:hypothetical protein